jgi:TPP-dependent pyruvate/acetoin dehydrogenase alpha subunit
MLDDDRRAVYDSPASHRYGSAGGTKKGRKREIRLRRYPAFDPPEYVNWQPDDEVRREFSERIRRVPARQAEIEGLDGARHAELYRGLQRFRLHDIALQRWVKQGVISKAWLGTGEEAATIGAVHALDRNGPHGDIVGPMIRNAGACHEMGMSVADMLRGYLATEDSPTGGRDLHVGGLEYGICTPISMVGSLSTVINGLGLAFKSRGESRVALTWIGDGATKHGEVHEALNFAAALNLPCIFVIQNNQVALGTRFKQHHAARDFSGWGDAYGVPMFPVDGNNVLDVYAATRLAAAWCREGRGPVFMEASTFRMGGHATHDVREARRTFPAELFQHWGMRDPVAVYEDFLINGRVDLGAGSGDTLEERNQSRLHEIEEEVTREVEAAAGEALQSREDRMPEPSTAGIGVYANGQQGERNGTDRQ